MPSPKGKLHPKAGSRKHSGKKTLSPGQKARAARERFLAEKKLRVAAEKGWTTRRERAYEAFENRRFERVPGWYRKDVQAAARKMRVLTAKEYKRVAREHGISEHDAYTIGLYTRAAA